MNIEDFIGKIFNEDCLLTMSRMPDKSIDLIVTDPPYNSQIDWDRKTDEFQLAWLKEAIRVLKDGGSFYCFFAPLNMFKVEGFIRENLTLKNILIWWHRNLYGAGLSYGKDRYKSTYEVIFYAVKGTKAKCDKNIQQEAYQRFGHSFDVFEIPAVLKNRLHKAQKPERLIEQFIYLSSAENDIVYDPFLGSGTTIVAAEQLNRRWTGSEILKQYYDVSLKRIKHIRGEDGIFEKET